MSDTHPLPELSSAGLNKNQTYLLLFVDLDVLYGSTSTVVLHWYQPNMVIRRPQTPPPPPPPRVSRRESEPPDGVLVNLTSGGAEYIAPQPPRNTHHRYVYLLFHQARTTHSRTALVCRGRGAGRSPGWKLFFVENDEPRTGTGTVTTTTTTTTTTSTSLLNPTTTWLRSAPCETATTTTTTTGMPRHTGLVNSVACERQGIWQIVM
ncbi:hypothetical protein AOCH_000945 [Aspergillus ochraceoroseus]|uniref:Phosphatidylethanolamine-binding protein n=1 Tax=Aspergillus ochraceoroseus TaxID=138278 RepID=A0A0F8V3Y6_9EURO|nr:hypothetical protein AOCH_000945 [Aspergillus ochraceoroseus]